VPRPRGYILTREAAGWVVRQSGTRRGHAAKPRAEESIEPALETVSFRNDSGETIPAFGVFRIAATVSQNGKTMFKALKPATGITRFAVNGPREVAVDKCGVAQLGPTVRVAYHASDTPSYGDSYGLDGWTARSFPSGQPLVQVLMLGIIDATERVARAQLIPYQTILVRAPSGGIPGRVGSLPGGAICDVLVMATANDQISVSSTQAKIYNWSTSAACANGDRYGAASWSDNRWLIKAEDCNDEGAVISPATITTGSPSIPEAIDTTIYGSTFAVQSREMRFTGTATGGGFE
jgi:hypothetical protein